MNARTARTAPKSDAAAPAAPVTPAAIDAAPAAIVVPDAAAARAPFGTPGFVPMVDAAVVANYRTADRAGMAAIRAMMGKRRDAAAVAAMAGDMVAVGTQFDAIATIAALAPAAAAVVVTPAFVTVAARIAELRAAADALAFGSVVPDGIDAADIDYAALTAIIDAAAIRPLTADASDAADAAATNGGRIAAARITRAIGTNNVSDIIAAAFADSPVGTFMTVAQIRVAGAHAATAGHITRDGAIAARLFPAAGAAVPSLPAGIVAVPRDADHAVRGAMVV